ARSRWHTSYEARRCRPQLEALEGRLQPGSLLTNPFGWSWVDSLLVPPMPDAELAVPPALSANHALASQPLWSGPEVSLSVGAPSFSTPSVAPEPAPAAQSQVVTTPSLAASVASFPNDFWSNDRAALAAFPAASSPPQTQGVKPATPLP